MITRKQLIRIAKENRINPYYQEKEYFQLLFLYHFYRDGVGAVFKGGTCLKICYRHMRYSEDLDFDWKEKPRKIKSVIGKTVKSIADVGIDAEIVKDELFEKAYTCRVRFKGPLFSGNIRSTNRIQIDIGDRGKIYLKPKLVSVYPAYPDLGRFFILAMREEEILAEKICAMHERSAPRDLFDVWDLLEGGVKVDRRVLNKKKKERRISSSARLLFPMERKYKEGIAPFLSFIPPYKQVVSDVKKALEE